MILKLRCGETYNFHSVKEIIDNGNGVITIRGNFKPRGRNLIVSLFKMTIENWEDVVNVYPIIQKSYYCSKCKVIHNAGENYEKHKMYYKTEEDLIPTDRILEADFSKLKPVGVRQYNVLLKKLNNNPNKRKLFIREINKLLIYEGVNTEKVL